VSGKVYNFGRFILSIFIWINFAKSIDNPYIYGYNIISPDKYGLQPQYRYKTGGQNMRKAYKCSELYTATFEDGTLMTGTLDQLYAAQNNRRMTIKPVVWLWCSDNGLYMVDYILEGAGWTLGVFDTLPDAEKAVAAFNAQPAADLAAMLTETALKRFTCEVECKALGDDGKQYNAVWCPDCGQIYYTIPAKVKVLGYIPQYKED
jgi:hypothetical protein